MADSAPRKRRRPAKACEQCRQRKVRCDLNVPCGPCSRAKSSPDCTYRDGNVPLHNQSRGKRVLHSQSRPQGIAGSVLTPPSPTDAGTADDDFHQTVRDIHGRLASLEKQLKTNEASAQRPSLERELRALTARIETIEGQLTSSSSAVSLAKDKPSVGVLAPRLRSSARKVKFLGPTHWCNKMDQLSVANMLNKSDTEPSLGPLKNEAVDIIKECRELRQAIKSQSTGRLNEPLPNLRSTVPSKEACDELVYCYLRTFESVYRVIHIPSFWADYDEFWRQDQANMSPFLVKLLLILAIGTVFHSGNGNTSREEQQLVQKWIYAAQWWLAGPSEKTTVNLDGLQAMCLLLIARKACGLGPSPWLSTGSLMRAAVNMGLHRDPTKFPSLSALQAEMRLRLWATVLELLLQDSLDSATPILVPGSFDSSAPSNFDDKDLNSTTTSISLPELDDRLTDSSVQILLHNSVRLRMQVVEVIHDCQGQSYQQALDLGNKLRTVRRQVATFFRSAKNRKINSTLQLTDFHAKFIDIQLHRYTLALYAPFVVQARKDPQYYYARKACLESARIIASYTETLHLPCEIPDDLMRLCVSGKGSFKGPLSLDIISVLGLEIVTQLEEEGLPSCDGDPLDRLADANRDHLIQILEHIVNQLSQIIGKGVPSMKRFGLLAAVLGQIRAMKTGQDVKQTVYEAITKGFKDCLSALHRSTPQPGNSLPGPSEGTDEGTNVPAGFDICDPTLSDINMDLGDPFFDLDLQGFFSPGLDADILSLLR
ncbi:uncharacterized protein BDV17DRAFT_104879 [Aspergillus undulatus]|uniref:uncharacterized protein n=1 Tax=Aspergillus undulatus TaxID=1810928 RepID=UPI003CCE145F